MQSGKWSWLPLVAVGALVFVLLRAAGGAVETLPYSELQRLVDAGAVRDVVLSSDRVRGTLKADGLDELLPADTIAALRTSEGEHRFRTVRPEDPGLIARLEAAGVPFRAVPESRWPGLLLWMLLPLLVVLGFWWLMVRRLGGGALAQLGKSKARIYVEDDTKVTFADVAGIDEAREELVEIVDILRAPQRYQRLGGKIPKGVLLVGPPGTGKTLLAKAVAGEARVPFFSLSGSEFVEMFVGVGAARVRDLFHQAQEKAPCIIFIDELDAIAKARGLSVAPGGHEEREQTLNQLLAELDGFDGQKGAIILGATNRPEILDPALLRPGRFDRQVVLDRPDLHGRLEILRVHARDVRLAPAVDLSVIAARTPGLVGADLANVLNEGALLAARAGKRAIELADLDAALDRAVGGLERRSRAISPREKRIIAHHESGHALLAELRPHADPVAKVTIIPRGVAALGHTQQLPKEDRYLLTRAELSDRLDVLLGGRLAEEIVFGDVSTGAQDDLRRATDIARQMIGQFGMGERLLSFDPPERDGFPGMKAQPYSEQTGRLIEVEAERLLQEARARVQQTLLEHRETLEALAALLIEREVVDRDMLRRLLGTPAAVAAAS